MVWQPGRFSYIACIVDNKQSINGAKFPLSLELDSVNQVIVIVGNVERRRSFEIFVRR